MQMHSIWIKCKCKWNAQQLNQMQMQMHLGQMQMHLDKMQMSFYNTVFFAFSNWYFAKLFSNYNY